MGKRVTFALADVYHYWEDDEDRRNWLYTDSLQFRRRIEKVDLLIGHIFNPLHRFMIRQRNRI